MKVDRLLLLVIALLFFPGSFVNAGPLGNFFRKVGQSISRPREPQPQPPPQPTRPQPAKTPHPTRRSSPRPTPAAEAKPSPSEGASSKEEESTPSVRPVSAADIEKVKAALPYAVPVPGRKGMVTSPYTPEDGKYIDVTGFTSGSIVKDPYTGKFFLVP
jgi:hypothetical protein